MTTRNNQQQENSNLSEAARTMRTSDNPEERSEAAREMGHAGGQHSHGGHSSTQGGSSSQSGSNSQNQQSSGSSSNQGSSSSQGQSGSQGGSSGQGQSSSQGSSSGQGQQSSGSSNRSSSSQGSDSHLSEAARTMRTSDDPEERSEAAREMGHIGGQHSHDRDDSNSSGSSKTNR